MSRFTDDPQFSPKLRVMQIIALALMAGVVMFMVIVLARPAGPPPLKGDSLTLLAVLFMALNLPLAFVLPRYMAKLAVNQLSRDPRFNRAAEDERIFLTEAFALIPRYQAGMIMGFAFLEGAAFFGLIAYMEEQELPGMIVAAVCLAAMLLQFPTRYKLTRWVENRQLELEEIRRQR